MEPLTPYQIADLKVTALKLAIGQQGTDPDLSLAKKIFKWFVDTADLNNPENKK